MDTLTPTPVQAAPRPSAPSVPDGAGGTIPETGLPIGRRGARALLLAVVLVVAAAGLVYELALVAVGSFLFGNTVRQTALVLSVFVCAMGVGSLAAKPLLRRPVAAFAVLEAALALVGGLSVLLAYAAFAWLDLYEPAVVVVAAAIGAMVGAELPLLMSLVQRIRRQDAGAAVSDLFAADYIGALAGGLAFPFLLLPWFGLLRGAIAAGVANALCAAVVALWLFGRTLDRPRRVALAGLFAIVVAVLAGAWWLTDDFEVSARQRLYRDPIVHTERSRYQEIVLTESVSVSGDADARLYLNGDLQFSSADEYRYHEALVHPAMAGRHRSVLILGGGDGLAAREVLRYPDVARLVEVELDPAMLALARTDARLTALNGAALDDPRVTLVTADAFAWLREAHELFDVVVVDMPDPDDTATAKLYSREFYEMVGAVLAPGGRVVVQAGSPYFAPDAYWCVVSTLEAAGLAALPYHVDVPSFGDWGYALAGRGAAPALAVSPPPGGLRFVDGETLAAAGVFPPDRRRSSVDVSTLLHPVIADYVAKGWRHW